MPAGGPRRRGSRPGQGLSRQVGRGFCLRGPPRVGQATTCLAGESVTPRRTHPARTPVPRCSHRSPAAARVRRRQGQEADAGFPGLGQTGPTRAPRYQRHPRSRQHGQTRLGQLRARRQTHYRLARMLARERPDITMLTASQGKLGLFRDAIFVRLARTFRSRVVVHLRGSGYADLRTLEGRWPPISFASF